jgi:hypothetical protein
MRAWCLNFSGRVKLASVKNFQLQAEERPAAAAADADALPPLVIAAAPGHADPAPAGAPPPQMQAAAALAAQQLQQAAPMPPPPTQQKHLLQFGRMSQDIFALDWDPSALSALQAFGIALTAFGPKVLL